MVLKPVAYYRCPLEGKFGLPRQAGLASALEGEVVLEPEFKHPDALRGMEGFDYLWLIWGFHLNREGSAEGHLTVRPPRLGGNERLGVFATRSPYRPNPLGLSSVRIVDIDPSRGVIRVSGSDLADGTPVFDIKPYVEYADSHPGVRSGFVDASDWKRLELVLPENKDFEGLTPTDVDAICQLICEDPRPQYQHDPQRIYHLSFRGHDIAFRIEGNRAVIL